MRIRLLGKRPYHLFLRGHQRVVFRAQLFLRRRGDRILVPLGDGLQAFHRLGALENACKRVVIRRWNGIKLVIVTARAAERQAEQRFAERVNLLVDDIHLHLHLVRLSQNLWPE